MLPKKIKIPKQLATAIAGERKLRKAMDTFLVLKAMNTSGHFLHSKNEKSLAAACQVGVRTFHTRISAMVREGLAKKEYGGIRLASWDKIIEKYFLPDKDFYYVIYVEKLEYVLESTAIKEAQTRQRNAYFRKLQKAGAMDELTNVFGCDPRDRRAVLKSQVDEHSNSQSERVELMHYFNADDNFNYEWLSIFFQYRSIGGMAYKKRKLSKLGLISVKERLYEINPHRYTSKIGNVWYSRPGKKRILQMCDEIRVLQ